MHLIALFIYAALLAVGGLMGYLKAGSLASLAMGVSCGALLAVCAWAQQRGCRWSRYTTWALLGLLLAFFSWRLAITQQLWPAGGVLMATLITTLLQLPCNCFKPNTNYLSPNNK